MDLEVAALIGGIVGVVFGFLIAYAIIASRSEKKVEEARAAAGSDRDQMISDKDQVIAEKDRLLVEHQHSLSAIERDTKHLLLEKDAERDRIVADKEKEIAVLHGKMERISLEGEQDIADIRSKMAIASAEKDAETAQAVAEKEKVISTLQGQIEQARTAQQIVADARLQFSNDASLLTKDMKAHTERSMRESMRENNEHFLKMAGESFGSARQRFEELVKPLSDSYQKLNPQIETLGEQNKTLLAETTRLSTAMTDHQKTGRWGEIQLRRLVEMAGMTEHCDFAEQETIDAGRPDMIVRLPEERFIPVDSKVSTSSFMDFMDDQNNREALDKHVRAMKNHVDELGRRKYGDSMEFCGFSIMFVPGDQLLAAALRGFSGLVEYAMERHVVIATPASLIAMLWAIERGWKQNRLANDAKKIAEAGNTLHQRFITFIKHLGRMSKKLEGVVEDHNKAIASYDHYVHTQGVRLAGLLGKDDTPDAPAQIGQIPSASRKVDQLPAVEEESA